MSSNSHHIPRLCHGTIDGRDMRIRDYETISGMVPLNPNERIHLLWMDSNNHELMYRVTDEIIVGISDHRIFKMEKGGITNVPIKDINKVTYVDSGVLSWDKIETHIPSGKESISMSPSSACKYFYNYLSSEVQRYQQEGPRPTNTGQQQQQQQQLSPPPPQSSPMHHHPHHHQEQTQPQYQQPPNPQYPSGGGNPPYNQYPPMNPPYQQPPPQQPPYQQPPPMMSPSYPQQPQFSPMNPQFPPPNQYPGQFQQPPQFY